ncbi:MAG: hypothetical protein J5585_08580 [Clostridia bacterium]|nr:hypothetical protein [Clostridia bacterium]
MEQKKQPAELSETMYDTSKQILQAVRIKNSLQKQAERYKIRLSKFYRLTEKQLAKKTRARQKKSCKPTVDRNRGRKIKNRIGKIKNAAEKSRVT